MNYTIEWTTIAEDQLAAAWLNAADPEAVTVTSRILEQHLAINPLRFGVSLESSVSRTAILNVLAIWFEVIEDDKRVIVHAIALV